MIGRSLGATKPRHAAPADAVSNESPVEASSAAKRSSFNVRSFLRTAAGKVATVALATGVAAAGIVAFAATSSASSQAYALVSSPSPSATVSVADLAAQRDQALADQGSQIDAASQNAAAISRDRDLGQTNAAIATEADRLKNLASFQWPTKGNVISPFGMRLHPILHIMRLHDGVDVHAPCGQDVFAAQSGTVITAEMGYSGGEGNNVHIDHGDINGSQIETGYMHLTDYVVTVGQHVDKGQLIGHVGTTGLSSGCHLHFLLHKDGQPHNPLDYAKEPVAQSKKATKD